MEQAELSIQAALYKDNLVLEQANKKLEIDQMYHQRWLDTLNQMNIEINRQQEWDMMQEGFKHDFEVIEQNYQNDLAKIDKEHAQAKERIEIEYQNNLKLLKEEDKLEKQRAKEEYNRKIALLEKETEEKKKVLAAETEEAKKLLEYEQSLKQTTIGGDTEEKGDKGGSTEILPPSAFPVTQTNNSPKVNMDSVLALGYGPISEKTLAKLVSSGQVLMSVSNGQIYYRKNPVAIKLKGLYN